MSDPALPGATVRQLNRALDLLERIWANEQAALETRAARRGLARPSRTGQAAKACVGCRKVKAKCLNSSGGDACDRCLAAGLGCTYPAEKQRGPKKQLSKNQDLVREIRLALRSVLSGTSPASIDDTLELAQAEHNHFDDDHPTEQHEADELSVLLRNPLATLADVAHYSSIPPQPAIPRHPLSGPAGSYYDSGVYRPRPETNFSLDPILCGILTHLDLERLVHFYFAYLYPYIWHLDPDIHSADFLRLNSPFLTLALCAVAASFDPTSAQFAATIYRHAQDLGVKAFAEGHRTIEVVQGFVMLAHWAQPENHLNEDRAWTWQSEAIRVATEIRLDLPVKLASLQLYRTTGPGFGLGDVHRFQRSQSRTWSLLFAGELAMGVQTGRIEAIAGLSLPGGFKTDPPPCEPTSADYLYQANDHLTQILGRVLNLWAGLRYEEASPHLHQSFVLFWKPELNAWSKRWTAINPFMEILVGNFGIVLNLVSLQFPGGLVQTILRECRAAAIQTITKTQAWPNQDQGYMLSYASNFVIVNIAYGAMLLLQLSHYFDRGLAADLQASCLDMADILERIGHDRLNGRSIATLHAKRIRARCHALGPAVNTSPPPPPPPAPAAAVPQPAPPQHETYGTLPGPEGFFGLADEMGVGAGWADMEGWSTAFSNKAMDALASMVSDPMLGGLAWGTGLLDNKLIES